MAASATVPILLVAAPPASATGACPTRQLESQDGAYQDFSTAVFGARANIQFYDPLLCTSTMSFSNSFSTAWAMVSSASPNNEWAQMGYMNAGPLSQFSLGVHYVSQWTDLNDANPPHTKVTGTPGTTSHRYQAYQSPSDGLLHMYIDSTSYDTSNYNPSGHWDPHWAAEYAGETGDFGSNVPGVGGNHVRFDGLAWYDSTGAQHYVTGLTGAVILGPRYYQAIGPYSQANGMYLDIWTSPA